MDERRSAWRIVRRRGATVREALTVAHLGHLMDALGPFEDSPRLAVGVSGGADSLCLCILADEWARARGGSARGLIVDHGLRAASAGEALDTAQRLQARGIDHEIIRIEALAAGSGVAARARAARFLALQAACARAGIVHLLLGHHAADQAETLLIRRASRSGPDGLAAMAAIRETDQVRVLRPLLGVHPARLRATLTAIGLDWVEDPTNADPASLRARLRQTLADPAPLAAAARQAGERRAAGERRIAAELARIVIRPEGFAVVPIAASLSPGAWSALIQMVSGARYPPASEAVARLAAAPGPATLGGVRVMRAGRLGDGQLVLREAAAMAAPVAALSGAVWDRRFRLLGAAAPGSTLGPLGPDAARMRSASDLPAAVLRTLPALRRGGALTVPHLERHAPRILFDPVRPAACAPFTPA